jgi:hypothetical protein
LTEDITPDSLQNIMKNLPASIDQYKKASGKTFCMKSSNIARWSTVWTEVSTRLGSTKPTTPEMFGVSARHHLSREKQG